MHYRRTEYFRYTFGEPQKAKFRVMMPDGSGKMSNVGECAIVDLSPGGAKIFTEFDIPTERNHVQLHLQFTLYVVRIEVQGEIVWKRPYRNGYLYGFEFEGNLEREELIIDELKQLRKLEVKNQGK